MSTTGKVVIIVVICVLLFLALCIGAGIYWVSRRGPQYLEAGKKNFEEGQAFGKTSDNEGCLAETLSRHKRATGLGASISQSLFLRACLDASRPTRGFCDDVPLKTDFVRAAQWQVNQCAAHGFPQDTYCNQLFAQVQDYCATGRSKLK
jgi:hypothetical protein